MDPVLTRKLFSKQPPESAGIGALIPEAEKNRAAALYSVARATDQFSKDVQGAEDYEQLMQSIRGDTATIEDRRKELAGIVGVADAERTPVAVLTVLQPAIEMLTQGGIAGLAEDPMATIPGEEPEMMPVPEDQPVQAFADGGFVRRFADGGPVDPEVTGTVAPTARPNPEFNQLFDQYNRVLQQQLGEKRSLEDMVRQRQDLFGPDTAPVNANLALMKFGAQVASTPGGLLQSLAKPMPALADDLGKVADQRLARDRAVKSGALDAVEKDRDRRVGASVDAAKQAFTEYNQRIRDEQTRAHQFQLQLNSQGHQSTQNELQRDFTANENELQRQQQSKENRLGRQHTSTENQLGRTHSSEERSLDRATTIGEGEANRSATRENQERQLTFQERQARLGQDHTLEVQRRQFDFTGTQAEKAQAASERAQEKEFKQRTDQMLKQAEISTNAAGYTLYVDPANPHAPHLAVKNTINGPVRADNGQPVPGNYVKLDENSRAIMGLGSQDFKEAKPYIDERTGTIYMGVQSRDKIYVANGRGALLPEGAKPYEKSDFKIGDAKPYVVEDPNARLGLRQVDAYDIGGKLYERQDGKLVPLEGVKSYKGDLNSLVEINTEGPITRYTPRVGPLQNQTFPVQQNSKGQGGNTPPSPAELQRPQQQGSITPQQVFASRKSVSPTDIQPDEAGPFMKVMPPPYSTTTDIDPQQQKFIRQKVADREKLFMGQQEVLDAVTKGVGPWAKLKNFTTDSVASWTDADWARFVDSGLAKNVLERFRTDLRASETLSRQYAVSEMKVIDNMLENFDSVFKDPITAKLAIQDLFRNIRNDQEYDKAQLEGRPFVKMERIPTGRSEDPFVAGPETMTYLGQMRQKGVDLTGVWLRFPDGTKQQIQRSAP